MWKRQPKNRRKGRNQILNVKLRSQETRALRTRRALQVFTLLMGGLLVLFVGVRGFQWAMDQLVFNNPSLAIRTVEIQTDGHIPVHRLRQWSRIKIGENILSLDLLQVKRHLELVPMIRSAAVERVLPNTVLIRIIEREPIAQMHMLVGPGPLGQYEPKIFFIDSDGVLISPVSNSKANEPLPPAWSDLPILTGIKGSELSPGKPVEAEQVRAALRLVEAFERSPMAGITEIKSIDLTGIRTLGVTTRQGNQVTFGLDNFDAQLRRWYVVHDYGLKMGKTIASLDLSVANYVPAQWLETTPAVAPITPKSSKPSRTKKKNV